MRNAATQDGVNSAACLTHWDEIQTESKENVRCGSADLEYYFPFPKYANPSVLYLGVASCEDFGKAIPLFQFRILRVNQTGFERPSLA